MSTPLVMTFQSVIASAAVSNRKVPENVPPSSKVPLESVQSTMAAWLAWATQNAAAKAAAPAASFTVSFT
jgi:hypothetical protein